MTEPLTLRPHQRKAVDELDNGKILCGDVGLGKTITALTYYVERETPRDVYVITTAKKRDSLDWQEEAFHLQIYQNREATKHGVLTVDSWNNIDKYVDVKDAFFIFDEQRLVGNGIWVKSFLKIAERNRWILLSATPGDTWLDYIPVFLANGFYRNRTEFKTQHVIYNHHAKFPKVDRYVGAAKLVRLKNQILVDMPYDRHTTRHSVFVKTSYDEDIYRKVWKDRWHVYENRPLRDVAELFSVARKVVNSDPSRLETVKELLSSHSRVIVFYNFDYELEMLRTLANLDVSLLEKSSNSSPDSRSTTGSGNSSSSSPAANTERCRSTEEGSDTWESTRPASDPTETWSSEFSEFDSLTRSGKSSSSSEKGRSDEDRSSSSISTRLPTQLSEFQKVLTPEKHSTGAARSLVSSTTSGRMSTESREISSRTRAHSSGTTNVQVCRDVWWNCEPSTPAAPPAGSSDTSELGGTENLQSSSSQPQQSFARSDLTTTSGSGSTSASEEASQRQSGSQPVQIAEWNGHRHEPVPKSDRWVYLVQYTAGSEGWNCIETDAMVMFSLTYSYKQWHQAHGRIDRLNTPYEHLYYYYLMSDATVDKAVWASLKEKRSFNEKNFAKKSHIDT